MKMLSIIALMLLLVAFVGCTPNYDEIALEKAPEFIKAHLKCPSTALFSELKIIPIDPVADSEKLVPLQPEDSLYRGAYDSCLAEMIHYTLCTLQVNAFVQEANKQLEDANKYMNEGSTFSAQIALGRFDDYNNMVTLYLDSSAIISKSYISQIKHLSTVRSVVLKRVRGFVDSQNGFGAMIRSEFIITMYINKDGVANELEYLFESK